MKKRSIDDKQVLRSSAQMAEIFCFYPFTIEQDKVAFGKKNFKIIESGQPFSIFIKSTALCLEVIHETLLDLAEGGTSLLDEIHVIKESKGILERTQISRHDLSKDKTVKFALSFDDHIQSVKQLGEEVNQSAIFALVYYWSEALRANYKLISPEVKNVIKKTG